MTNRWRRMALVVVAAVALSLCAGQASAQDRSEEPGAGREGANAVGDDDIVHSWTLVPASDEPERNTSYRPNLSFEVAPGTKIDDAVTVINYGSVQLTFEVFATDAFNNPDGDFDLLPTDEDPVDVGSWVTVGQRHVTVPANGSATLPITLDVPPDARPGDHVGAVLASAPVTGTGPSDQVVTFDRRTGTRLYVRVAGPLAPEVAATHVRTTYRPSLNPLSGTAEVTYRIENRGNVRLGAEHRASVSGPFGLLAQRSTLDTVEEILPGEEVTIRTTIDGVAATGVAVSDVDVDAIPIGGMEGAPSASGGSLAIAPPWALLAGLAVAALALYARHAYRRHEIVEQLHVAEPRP